MTSPHFINEPLLKIARRKDAILMHPHAQRTGGGTIRRQVLAKLFGQNHVYSRMFRDSVKPWSKLTDRDLEGCRAYTDLENFKEIRLSRPYTGLASLRHPLYRAISLYGLVRGLETHRHHELAMHVSLEEFYRRASAENPEYFRDLQSRRICRRADAKQAVETLKLHFVGVGFTNQLPAFVSALGTALGWPQLDIHDVAPDEERYAAVVTPALRDMVLDQNREDLALYETMQKGPPYTPPPRSWKASVNRLAEKGRRTYRRIGRRLS
ncbi:MAG TPA: hypothetical protein VGG10_00420 [Rhizomicrobium sp.]